jgi:hypothetical protein
LGRSARGALLHEELQHAIAPPSGRDLEPASLSAICVEDRTHSETLEKRAPRDVLRELINRDARLDVADIGLTQNQAIEWNIA